MLDLVLGHMHALIMLFSGIKRMFLGGGDIYIYVVYS